MLGHILKIWCNICQLLYRAKRSPRKCPGALLMFSQTCKADNIQQMLLQNPHGAGSKSENLLFQRNCNSHLQAPNLSLHPFTHRFRISFFWRVMILSKKNESTWFNSQRKEHCCFKRKNPWESCAAFSTQLCSEGDEILEVKARGAALCSTAKG